MTLPRLSSTMAGPHEHHLAEIVDSILQKMLHMDLGRRNGV